MVISSEAEASGKTGLRLLRARGEIDPQESRASDSVPAVLAITRGTFVVYSAVVFAVLGLRALYFALEGLIDRFVHLHYGLATILILPRAEFVLEGFGIHIPILVSLLIIAVIVTVSVVVSLITTRTGKIGKKGVANHNQADM